MITHLLSASDAPANCHSLADYHASYQLPTANPLLTATPVRLHALVVFLSLAYCHSYPTPSLTSRCLFIPAFAGILSLIYGLATFSIDPGTGSTCNRFDT
jgi:hypothetical protein